MSRELIHFAPRTVTTDPTRMRIEPMKSVYQISSAAAVLMITMIGSAVANEAENRAAVANAFEQWRAGTGSPFELLAKDAVWTIEGFAETAGSYTPSELQQLIRPFNAAIAAPLVPTKPTLYVDGDTVIARFKASTTLRSGETYENTYAWFMRFEEGQIIEVNAFLDLPAFEKTFAK